MTKQDLSILDRNIGQKWSRIIQEAFKHGIDCEIIHGGLLPNMTEQGLYEVSDVQNYVMGTLIKTPLGRKFRYCLSDGRCDTYIGNIFHGEIGTGADHVGIDFSAIAATAEKGATSIVMTNQGGHSIAKDALSGGIIVMNPSDGTNNSLIQEREIIGNTAGGPTDEITITFAGGLIRKLVGETAYAYCMPSPYSKVRAAQIGDCPGKASFVGYAAAEVAVSGIYHWEQTAGLISVSLYGSAVGQTQYFRDVVFRYDGNLIHRGLSGATGLEAQRAGYIVDKNVADNGATLIMLELEP